MGVLLYIRILAGIFFVLGGVYIIYTTRKDHPKKELMKWGGILLFLAGTLELISALWVILLNIQ